MENLEYNKELHYQKQVRTLKLPLKPNIKVLDVSGLKLKDLSFLSDQQDIEILIAESNELTNQCFKEIAHLKKLKILSLQDNQIVDDANIKLLADTQLLELRLLFNPICQTQQYYIHNSLYQSQNYQFTINQFIRLYQTFIPQMILIKMACKYNQYLFIQLYTYCNKQFYSPYFIRLILSTFEVITQF